MDEPPKKKRNVGAKPGRAREYLDSNYGAIPENTADVLNGHILFLYVCNGSSPTKIERSISARFPEALATKRMVRTLVDKFKKLKHLTKESEFLNFKAICFERFSIPCLQHVDTSGSGDGTVDSSSSSVPLVEPLVNEQLDMDGDGAGDRHGTLELEAMAENGARSSAPSPAILQCPSCVKLRQRLKDAIKHRTVMRKKDKVLISSLKKQLGAKRQSRNIRVLNQKIKRKNIRIKTLLEEKQKYAAGAIPQDLDLKKELQKSKRKIRRLKKKSRDNFLSIQAEADVTVSELQCAVKDKDEEIQALHYDKSFLEDEIEKCNNKTSESTFSKEGKTYSIATRLFIYDAVMAQTPTRNVPSLLANVVKRTGAKLDSVPHRSTVEAMVRELGVITDLQAGEAIRDNKDLTLGFDATTQEGVHINSAHVTFPSERCLVMGIDQLPGGTADDYNQHICSSVDELSNVYSSFYEVNYQDTRKELISSISNSLTDRVASNHAAIRLINEAWDKTLLELNCHLHPLDTIASRTRSCLKNIETAKGKLFGKDCVAGNIVLQCNKVRYKDGKGDPQGFKIFLEKNNLGRGFLPRYRGNRLHIVFHISGKLFAYHELFVGYFQSGTTLGGLRAGLLEDFQSSLAKVELQVLGLLGKFLTGPWMSTFYTSNENEINHLEGIKTVQNVIERMQRQVQDPAGVLKSDTDFFGNKLDSEKDRIFAALQQTPPDDLPLFESMMSQCLESTIAVLNKQYERYFKMDVTEELKKQTASARSHNIDAEEIMGMFSAALQKAPNATLCYLSSKLRAQKNKVMDYLDNLPIEKRDKVINFAISYARKRTTRNRKRQKEIQAELSRRSIQKLEKKNMAELKKIEKKLKTMDKADIEKEYQNLEGQKLESLLDLWEEKVIGRDICHIWYDSETQHKTVYNGRIVKFVKRTAVFKIAYWDSDGSFEDAEDFLISKYALGADLLADDLVIL